MTQPTLLDGLTPPPPRKNSRVSVTSAQAFHALPDAAGRAGQAARDLAHLTRHTGHSATIGELTCYLMLYRTLPGDTVDPLIFQAMRVNIARAVSDAKAAGLVEIVPDGDRVCAKTGRRAHTWRIKQR